MKIVFREIMEIELLMECIANMQKYARINPNSEGVPATHLSAGGADSAPW